MLAIVALVVPWARRRHGRAVPGEGRGPPRPLPGPRRARDARRPHVFCAILFVNAFTCQQNAFIAIGELARPTPRTRPPSSSPRPSSRSRCTSRSPCAATSPATPRRRTSSPRTRRRRRSSPRAACSGSSCCVIPAAGLPDARASHCSTAGRRRRPMTARARASSRARRATCALAFVAATGAVALLRHVVAWWGRPRPRSSLRHARRRPPAPRQARRAAPRRGRRAQRRVALLAVGAAVLPSHLFCA